MESGVTVAVGLNTTNSWNYASSAYGSAASGAASDAKVAAANADTSARNSNATSVTLSDEAKAYLAANADTEVSPATLAANARQFFDQQYATLGISSRCWMARSRWI